MELGSKEGMSTAALPNASPVAKFDDEAVRSAASLG